MNNLEEVNKELQEQAHNAYRQIVCKSAEPVKPTPPDIVIVTEGNTKPDNR